MKRFLSFAAFVLLMTMTAFSLAACGDDDEAEVSGGENPPAVTFNIQGSWMMTHLRSKDSDPWSEMPQGVREVFRYDAAGNYSVYLNGEEVLKGTYTLTDKKINITYGENKQTYEILSLKDDVVELVLYKSSGEPSAYYRLERTADDPTEKFVTRTFTVNGVQFSMVAVEGGKYNMGTTDMTKYNTETQTWNGFATNEMPKHEVILGDFYIGETEVTQALWKAVMGDKDFPFEYQGDNYPMWRVSKTACEEFIVKLNKLTKRHFRLPTEEEWEYAAQGGKYYPVDDFAWFAGENEIVAVGWYKDNSGDVLHQVGQMKANRLGLKDMIGNLEEWTSSVYKASYASDAQVFEGLFVVRGGNYRASKLNCRSQQRTGSSPSSGYWNNGFRLVKDR